MLGLGLVGRGDRDELDLLELVLADGSLVEYSRESSRQLWEASAVSLGLLGVAARISLDIVPSFDVQLRVVAGVPFALYLERLHEINAVYDSVR